LASPDEKRLKKELVVLFVILVGLGVLSVRPFGFRNFLHGLANNDLFSITLAVGIVGVSLVMLQRLGIIFPDASAEKIT
jgi:hypothetical protein